MTSENSIFQTLRRLNLTSTETRIQFSGKTRDRSDLVVWRDQESGVIYIDNFFAGKETYETGSYRKDRDLMTQAGLPDYERATDARRRYAATFNIVAGKNLLDFGCGNGDFLRLVKDHCVNICGLELQRDYIARLNADGIRCVDDLAEIPDKTVEICTLFHVLEHLPDPIEVLRRLKKKLVKDGMVYIEVPHANDFLLTTLGSREFKQFTLWSQHLLLHTRESLRRLLEFVGFEEIYIEGLQRYPLSNHLNWLANGRAGGHKSPISVIDSQGLMNAYANSLAKIDATDHLVAIAKSAN